MKSGLFVSLPALFFFFLFWSNPHNPLGVICSCSVIWGKASLSPLSLQLYLRFIPSSTSHTLIFTVICERAAVIGCSAASKLHSEDDITICVSVSVCVFPHVQVHPPRIYVGLKIRTIPQRRWINEHRAESHDPSRNFQRVHDSSPVLLLIHLSWNGTFI